MAIIDYKDDLHRDTSVKGPFNVYAENGQGCGTVWFSSVAQARKTIKKFGRIPKGQDSECCKGCSCHYSYGTKRYNKYPEFACNAWKHKIAIGE